jgi:membrane fusion protein (multidrug efflux system)
VATDNAEVEGHIVPVLPKVTGYVARILVDENQQVRAGDTLAVLDDRDFRARLEQAEADLRVALANAGGRGRPGQAEAQLAAARAAVAQAQAADWKAKQDIVRYRELAGQGLASQQDLEAYEAGAQAADAQLRAATEQAKAMGAAVTGADAKAASSRAARDQAALTLSYTRIVAPVSGVVSKKTLELGQLVQAGQPLFAVVPLDDVWIVANLKETEIKNVDPGDAVDIKVDSYPGRRFRGHVESLSPASGAKFSLLPPDNATGNFTKVVQRIPVRIRLDGPRDPAHPLRPGMSVTAVIHTT